VKPKRPAGAIVQGPVGPGGVKWAKRVKDLIEAVGWNQAQREEKFGVSGAVFHRIFHGGRPAVKFILRLCQLEQAYAQEIEDFKAGLIRRVATGSYGRAQRIDWREPAQAPPRDRGLSGGDRTSVERVDPLGEDRQAQPGVVEPDSLGVHNPREKLGRFDGGYTPDEHR
jgi:transcriptional regulator with XRE-family HTH domain